MARDLDPDKEAWAVLKGDYPPQVKARVRLSLAGGRRAKRLCVLCQKPGIKCMIWCPAAALSPAGFEVDSKELQAVMEQPGGRKPKGRRADR